MTADPSCRRGLFGPFQSFSIACLAILCLTTGGLAHGQLAVKAGKVIPVVGDPISPGVILIDQGKITAVGKDVAIPVEYKVIEMTDGVVMPGLIDPHASSGMSQANEQNSNVPFLSVVDSIDPSSPYFEQCLRNGVTTAAVVPGNSTMIGGRSAIVKTAGAYVNDMLLVRDAGLKISLRPIRGSRMSHLSRLRRELDNAKRSIEDEELKKKEEEEKEAAEKKKAEEAKKKAAEKDKKDAKDEDKKDAEKKDEDKKEEADGEKKDGDEKPEEEEAESMRQLKALLQGKQKAFIYCDRAMDVAQAVALTKQYGFEARLVLSPECYKAADLLADQEATVIVDANLVFWETDPRTRDDEKIVVTRELADAGVPFVFQANLGSSPQSIGTGYFWFQAATAVAYGMDRDEALKSLTLGPAELLGIDQMVGSIEVGKDADLVIYSGDPLEMDSWVQTTIVGGEVAYERDEDDKLKRLLENPEA